MNKNQKGIVHLFLLLIVILVAIGAIGYLAYQNAQLRKQTEETTSTPVSEDSTDDRCYWEFRTITPVGTPTKWTGWYNDMNTVPNKCKPITLSTGDNPGIPFESEEECKKTCVSEVFQSLQTLENIYPVEHRPGDRRYYQSTKEFTYEDILYNFSINIPANYYLRVGNGREVFTEISNQTHFTEGELPEGIGWFYLAVGDEFPPSTPQDNLENFVNSYLDSPNLTIINSTDTKIDDKSAKRVTVRPYDWDYPLTTYYFVKRDRVYSISCKYNQEKQLNLCEELIKTIKFTE